MTDAPGVVIERDCPICHDVHVGFPWRTVRAKSLARCGACGFAWFPRSQYDAADVRRQYLAEDAAHGGVPGRDLAPPGLASGVESAADEVGGDAVTGRDLLKKLPLVDRPLELCSLDTVQMFHRDARQAGYQL